MTTQHSVLEHISHPAVYMKSICILYTHATNSQPEVLVRSRHSQQKAKESGLLLGRVLRRRSAKASLQLVDCAHKREQMYSLKLHVEFVSRPAGLGLLTGWLAVAVFGFRFPASQFVFCHFNVDFVRLFLEGSSLSSLFFHKYPQ